MEQHPLLESCRHRGLFICHSIKDELPILNCMLQDGGGSLLVHFELGSSLGSRCEIRQRRHGIREL